MHVSFNYQNPLLYVKLHKKLRNADKAYFLIFLKLQKVTHKILTTLYINQSLLENKMQFSLPKTFMFGFTYSLNLLFILLCVTSTNYFPYHTKRTKTKCNKIDLAIFFLNPCILKYILHILPLYPPQLFSIYYWIT